MSSEPGSGAPAGHDEARRAVSGALARGSLGRALLVTGEDGLGKRDFASWVVRASLCPAGPARGDGAGACESCPTCRKVAAGQHPDLLLVVRGDEDLGSRHEITVAQVREGVVPFLGLRPVEAVARAVIVCDADEMNEEAQNALLKTLEEPPGGSRLVLTSSREEVLLDTVRSRCQSLRLLPLSDDELQRRHPEADPALVRLARGRPGRLAELQSLEAAAVWLLMDAVLCGRRSGSAFATELEALLDAAGNASDDPLSGRRLALDLLRTRLRDLVLHAAGGDTAGCLTPPPSEPGRLPSPGALLAVDAALLEAGEDLRRHLPGPVVWGALGRALAASRRSSATPGPTPPG